MSTTAEASIIHLKAQSRNPVEFRKLLRVVEYQVLAEVSEVRMRASRVHIHRVPSRDSVIIGDLVRVRVINRVEQKEADSSHPLEAIDPVTIQRDVE